MKTKKPVVRRIALAAGALLCCALNLPAQTAPTITTQPTNQTVLAGSNATFSVAVSGTGPFTYQWQFNGTNFSNNIITTVAGNGNWGYYGDGGAATKAELYLPFDVALDAFGNLFIADYQNNRIRKVATNGIITTAAGGGSGGDGGAATNAGLFHPAGVAVDSSGSLYIADYYNNRIREVGANGIIKTVAGTNAYGYSGDGGPATNACLHGPTGVAVDPVGNLYVADKYNNRIRMVGTNGIINTVAGNGTAKFSGDGGPATNACLNGPFGVAVDSVGNLYIADCTNNCIRKVDTGGNITTMAGTGVSGFSGDGGPATNANLRYPESVAFDFAGDLYIADNGNNRIREVDPNGIITTVAGNPNSTHLGDGGAPTNALLNSPAGVALDPVGNLYIADSGDALIRKALLYGEHPAFTVTNAGVFSLGNYTVVISNPYGSVTSAVVTLTLEAPPVITVQPASQIVLEGSSPVLSVTVAGSGPFGYLCYFGGTNLVQSGTNSAFTLPAFSTNNAGNYTVVVTNAWGSVTSRVVSLTVAFPPSVTIQQGSQSVLAGSNVSFGVTVGGTGPFRYQWQFNGSNLQSNIITTVAGNGSTSVVFIK